jgi:uncharacterized membrane protein YedE/YeeE
MLNVIASLVVGVLFGVGLTMSQMINPAKVAGFLDVAGRWDPTLAMVMAGALITAAPGFWMARKWSSPVLTGRFYLPSRNDVDFSLIAGAALFGVGWGISGFCPGPAISALGFGDPGVAAFVAAMVGGMLFHRIVLRGKWTGPMESSAG